MLPTLQEPPPNPPAGRYAVHVLLAAPETLEPAALAAALARHAPELEAAPSTGTTLRFLAAGDAASAPALLFEPAGVDPELLAAAAEQTWDWADGPAVAGACAAALTVSDAQADSLDRAARLHRVRAGLSALLDLAPARALLWEPAQRLVEPAAFRESLAHGGPPGDHAINVRMFALPDAPAGERLMDTLGLAAFGLPDLQCRFAGLQPGAVAALLMSYGEYLFQKGDVIGDGDAVRGINPLDEWECRRIRSSALPARTVLELRPG